MINEPRTYRHPVIQLVMLVMMFGILAIGFLVSGSGTNITSSIPFLLFIAVIFMFSLFSLTAKITISDEEISTTNLLGTKTLRWSEIESVSGRGYGIKLHNRDGDVTVSPNPQLNGYDEVIEFIGSKRPDLFSPQDYGEMTKRWTGIVMLIVISVLLFGMGLFLVTQTSAGMIPLIFFLIVAGLMAFVFLSMPKSVVLDGDTLLVKYYFREVLLRAHEIASLSLGYTRSRNGKNYFIRADLINKKYIRLSNIGSSLPISYLVLKNWHKQHVRF